MGTRKFYRWVGPAKKNIYPLFQTIKLPETFILKPDTTLHRKIIGAYEGWNTSIMKNELQELSQNSG